MINLMTTCRDFAALTTIILSLLQPQLVNAQSDNAADFGLPNSSAAADVIDLPNPIDAELALPNQNNQSAFEAEILAELPDVQVPSDLPPSLNPDFDVLARGQLHEAFATAHAADPVPAPLIAQTPPTTIDELPSEYKPEGSNVQWIPGYWAWDDAQNDFIWISGVWRDVPPGRRWIPGYWESSNQGHRWISGFWSDEKQQELQYLPNPPASIDRGPSTIAPSANHFYVPGNWEHSDDRFRWNAGYWQPVTENWVWIPARYVWTPNGCLYQRGYWDFELESRGTCFAPIYFKRPVYAKANYTYRPAFSIDIDLPFLAHLFVNARRGHYYFGDYYSNSYGYKPWVSYSSHRRHYDPLLTYYRCFSFNNYRNKVDYLARQHYFYSKNHHYRPRSTFAAQSKFARQNQQLYNANHIVKSNYIRAYTKSSKSKVAKSASLARQLQNKNAQIRQAQASELAAARRRAERLTELKTQRRRSEVHSVRNSSQVRTSVNRQRTMKLPSQSAVDTNKRPKQSVSQKRAAELRAELSRKQKQQISERQAKSRDLQRKQQTLTKAAKTKPSQRSQPSPRKKTEQIRRTAETAKKLQQQQRSRQSQIDRTTRDANRAAQQQKTAQQARQRQQQQAAARRLKQQQAQRDSAKIKQQATAARLAQQQKTKQQSQQREQLRAKQRQQQQAKQASARRAEQQKAQQNAARIKQQKAQRDTARRAQQKADSARRSQQKSQRDSSRRSKQSSSSARRSQPKSKQTSSNRKR